MRRHSRDTARTFGEVLFILIVAPYLDLLWCCTPREHGKDVWRAEGERRAGLVEDRIEIYLSKAQAQ